MGPLRERARPETPNSESRALRWARSENLGSATAAGVVGSCADSALGRQAGRQAVRQAGRQKADRQTDR